MNWFPPTRRSAWLSLVRPRPPGRQRPRLTAASDRRSWTPWPGAAPNRPSGPGACLFREGTALDCVYVVRRGLVGLGRRPTAGGSRSSCSDPATSWATWPPWLGGLALFDTFAVTEATVLVVPAAEFLDALDLRSPFGRQWAIGLGGRISALRGPPGGSPRRRPPLPDRRRSCTTNSRHGSRVVSLTQQTIADLLGVQRTSVTRTLQGLQRQGIIEIGYGHIAVRDHAALAKAAESDRAIA